MINKNREFILIEKKIETDQVTSLFLKPVDGLQYSFTSGQYVNIKPNASGYGKSYTISSAPYEKLICITIKRKGETSSTLIDMHVGEKIFLEGPYGYFYPDLPAQAGSYEKEIVMIAGGIGATPFYSVIKDIISSGKKTKVILFYSNQYIKDITFFDELNSITKNNSNINVVYCLTQEKTKHDLIKEYSRIDKNILKKHLCNFENKNYFICGSIEFVNSMWKLVKDEEVNEFNIFTEAFF